MTGLGEIDRSKLSGPFVNILKDVAVNSLKVSCIKVAWQWFVFELAETAGSRFGLELAEEVGVADVAQVPKKGRVGVDVRVHICGRNRDQRSGRGFLKSLRH